MSTYTTAPPVLPSNSTERALSQPGEDHFSTQQDNSHLTQHKARSNLVVNHIGYVADGKAANGGEGGGKRSAQNFEITASRAFAVSQPSEALSLENMP